MSHQSLETGTVEGIALRQTDRRFGPWMRLARSFAVTLLISILLVGLVEVVVRGSLTETIGFFRETYRPGWTTVALFALVFIFTDAVLGRAHNASIIIGPLVLALAFICHQKAYYLGDPLYPTDILYSRQILELLPMLAKERAGMAGLLAITVLGASLALPFAWLSMRRRAPVLSSRERALRLLIAAPALAFFVSIMDYGNFSWVRDRLQISPIMWDQKENYRHNGFALAFALNLPMAKVAAPENYSQAQIDAIDRSAPAIALPLDRPDIIMVMSESLWDPTRLPKTTFETDPLASIRAHQSGHVFSPEFGGMTSNVEFEALTGFSNAFLPYGSIPYQQYVRRDLPSLARFLGEEGYRTKAIHPFAGWFWNRQAVYRSLGFQDFASEETLPALEKRGGLASDSALTDQIIAEVDNASEPTFLFAVTLQGHGPYQPGRYADQRIAVSADTSQVSEDTIRMFAEGVHDADLSFQRLVDWAEQRERPTVIVLFGDHLPPLGAPYVETGFMPDQVASRDGTPETMRAQHETPLVIWSNERGVKTGVDTISPSLLPYHLLSHAGISHPFYTGLLGDIQARYDVVDRNILFAPDGTATKGWARGGAVDPLLTDYRSLQYDALFGEGYGAGRWHEPTRASPSRPWISETDESLPSTREPV